MDSFETLPDRKLRFLAQQKRVLVQSISTPLSKRLSSIAERSGIQEKVIKDVLMQVDRDIKRHAQEVYSRQMMDEVVEQIDGYYWQSAKPNADSQTETTDEFGDDDGRIYVTDDLSLDENISKLPSTWDVSADPTSSNQEENVDQDDYIAAVSRLQALSAQRLTMQQKLTTYRTLLALLEPYRKPKENIQPNIVWNDTPLAPELRKTRTLAIRVAGRVGEKYGEVQIPSSVDDDEDVEMGDDGKEKLNQILAGW